MNIIVFEDAGTNQLFPITTGRPAYAITCASYRLIDWLSEFGGNLVGLVRPYLETLQLHDYSELEHRLSAEFSMTWLINARLVPSVSNIQRLHKFKDEYSLSGGNFVAQQGWAIATAMVPTATFVGKSADQCRTIIADWR